MSQSHSKNESLTPTEIYINWSESYIDELKGGPDDKEQMIMVAQNCAMLAIAEALKSVAEAIRCVDYEVANIGRNIEKIFEEV